MVGRSHMLWLWSECMRLFTNERGTFGNVNGANAGGKEPFRFRRRSTSDAFDKGAGSENGPRNSPPTYGLWSLTQISIREREETEYPPKRFRFDDTSKWSFPCMQSARVWVCFGCVVNKSLFFFLFCFCMSSRFYVSVHFLLQWW